MGYRYQIMVDDECKQILDAIPEKKKSEHVRKALKAYELFGKQETTPQQETAPPEKRAARVHVLERRSA